MRSQSLDPKIGLTATLNSFETKDVGFCKRAADVIVVQFFNKFFTVRESNDPQTIKWINSIKFRVSLLAKHCTYQTLNECSNAAVNVVILPIEKYKSTLFFFTFIFFQAPKKKKKKPSRKRCCDRGQRQENPDRAKNQSDCRIRYRACLEKNKMRYCLN